MVVPLIQPTELSIHPGYSKEQWIFLFLFFICCFMNAVIFCSIGPLFPPEAMSKSLTASAYGPIMATVSGSMIVASFFATGAEKAGLKKFFGWSVFTVGASAVLIGLVHYIEDRGLFVTFSVLAFAINGFGATGLYSSIYMLCLSVFPTKTSMAIGIIESGFLAGICFGPILSELIFDLVGYTFTFAIFGAAQLLNSFAILLILPPLPNPDGVHLTLKDFVSGYLEILKFPSVSIFVISLAVLEMGNDFLTSMLEPELKPFNLSRIGVGLMFFSYGIPQILGPLWGWLLDRSKRPELILAASLFIIAFSGFFLGPLPFSPLEKTYGNTVVGLVLFGFGEGILDVATLVNFQLEVKEKRQNDSNIVNFSFVAIVYPFMSGIGGLIGPSVAGILFDQFGFGNAFIFLFTTHIALGLVIIFYMAQKSCHPRSVTRLNTGYQELP